LIVKKESFPVERERTVRKEEESLRARLAFTPCLVGRNGIGRRQEDSLNVR